MKNKLTDLNDHLFAQLERLSDENLKEENMDLEINRTGAIVTISEKIIDNARLALDAAKLMHHAGNADFVNLLPAVEGKPAPKKLPDFSKDNVGAKHG